MNVTQIIDIEQEDERMKIFLSVMRYIWPSLPEFKQDDTRSCSLPFQLTVSCDIHYMRELIMATDAWEDTLNQLAISQNNC